MGDVWTRWAASALAGLVMISDGSAWADVVRSGADHYVLRQVARSDLSPDAVWARLIDPSQWWADDHTFSGDAANVSLDLQAGGLWREDWDGGSVAHGRVLLVTPNTKLRLDAPFGPLQGMGVTVVWTITMTPEGAGTRVVFDEVAHGGADSGLDAMAPIVDAVKAEALQSLIAAPLTVPE